MVDAQRVKNADTAEQKGYDGGKHVSGIKRYIAVESNGLPLAIEVTAGNVTDRESLGSLCPAQGQIGRTSLRPTFTEWLLRNSSIENLAGSLVDELETE